MGFASPTSTRFACLGLIQISADAVPAEFEQEQGERELSQHRFAGSNRACLGAARDVCLLAGAWH